MVLNITSVTGYKPKVMREKTKQFLWNELMKAGHTNHSALAETLPYLVNRLEQEGRAYELSAHPGTGYHLKLITHVRDFR